MTVQKTINWIRDYLESLPGVIKVHDLHIWAMSTTETALAAHVVQDGSVDPHQVTAQARQQIKKRFGIGRSTLQWEELSCAGRGKRCAPSTVPGKAGNGIPVIAEKL